MCDGLQQTWAALLHFGVPLAMNAESQGETSGMASRAIRACHECEETLPPEVQSHSTKPAALVITESH